MVSAVILAYNRCAEVLKTISYLKKTKESFPYPLEIVVVDNGSVDDTSRQVAASHRDVVLVTKPVNNGIAGWNAGFAVAKGKYFLVLDDDSHVHTGLAEAVSYLEQHPDVGILAMQIKDEGKLDVLAPVPEDAWKDEDELVGFIGCGAMIRKEVFDQIGGYAEWIYMYTHEFEYGMRCLNAGFKIVFFGHCVVVHRTSHLNRSYKRLRMYAVRNEMAIIYKYFRDKRFKYMMRTFINNLKFIKKEGFMSGWYIILGFVKFLQLSRVLPYSPVSRQIQDFYSRSFWSAKPVIHKRKKYSYEV